MIEQKTYYGLKGKFILTVAQLAYSTILKVKRQGVSYDIIYTGDPGNRQVLYNPAIGSLLFNVPFEGVVTMPTPDVDPVITNYEPIYVLKKAA